MLQAEAHQLSAFGRFFGVDPLDRGAAAAYSGALAEVTVSDALAALGDEWTVVDSVAVASGEPPVDHLVIGPPGTFSIRVRNHALERVWVVGRTFVAGGIRVPHIRDAEHEADLIAERMSAAAGLLITVSPCLVVAAPDALTVRPGGRRVHVLLPGEVAGWLASLPRQLSPGALEARRAVALEPAFWAPTAARSDSGQVRLNFDLVRAQIVRSRRRRLGWVISGAILSQLLLIGAVLFAQHGLI